MGTNCTHVAEPEGGSQGTSTPKCIAPSNLSAKRIGIRTTQTFWGCLLWHLLVADAKTSIVPPPWANPVSNPCAAQPGGWQLLYWPDDGKCYKIFQIGAPCPETMELGPAAKGGGVTAECRCPPGTAQSPRDALCHPIFTSAACPRGQYFAPVPEALNSPGNKSRWGVCRAPDACPRGGQIFYPRDSKCYDKLTRGPCSKGQLLTLDDNNLAICSCATDGELGMFYWGGENTGCYEHYTRGPCSEPGEIFLPGSTCGCTQDLPHYHENTKSCYQLGGAGPCPAGQHFTISQDHLASEEIHAQCECKPNHVEYKNGSCYRLHTRGPCDAGDMLVNATTCVAVPCKRGRLYFPGERTCYKTGSRGPCLTGQVVLYDYSVRPSIDGISYNGICGYTTAQRSTGRDLADNENCEKVPGMFLINKTCYKLYTQGPCGKGEWLVARRRPRMDEATWRLEDSSRKVRCECRPGYTRTWEHPDGYHPSDIETNVLSSLGECQPPTVRLAKFLNDNINDSVKFIS